jgi:hypothetical protein
VYSITTDYNRLIQSFKSIAIVATTKPALTTSGVKGGWLGHTGVAMFPWGDIGDSFGGPGHSPGVLDAKCNYLHPRPSVHGEEPYPVRGDSDMQNTADLKE